MSSVLLALTQNNTSHLYGKKYAQDIQDEEY
jgi:hypothetical protein